MNNCPESLGLDPDVDCCYNATVGDEHFCSAHNPCGLNEGDCDSNNECENNLICDTISSCPTHLEFEDDMNCCFNVTGCKFY